MHVVERIHRIEELYGRIGLTIGNFEGFHRGHLKIIQRLISECRGRGLSSAAITFKDHPQKVLSGYDKIRCFKKSGIDLLFYVDFSPSFAATSPNRFILELQKKLYPKLLCLGKRFRFGKNNKGDIAFLKTLSSNIGFTLIPVVEAVYRNQPISSTRIRAAIKDGRFSQVCDMLGRDYSVYLELDEGRKAFRPFIPYMAFPESGLFSGVVEHVETGERYAESIRIEHGLFLPVQHRDYRNMQLYRFSFDPMDG
jgi:riboflavin kinase/FMN adenylyltransferase